MKVAVGWATRLYVIWTQTPIVRLTERHCSGQSLLDTSSSTTLREVTDLQLSREEDSVTSLSVTHRLAEGTLQLLVGINSSSELQNAGKNEHLREFVVTYDNKGSPHAEPKTDPAVGSILPVSKTSLFSPTLSVKKETYQRVLRTTRIRARGEKSRYAAIATGLAPEGEVVVFQPDLKGPPLRINLGKGQEAADLDLLMTPEGDILLGYCTDYEVHVHQARTSSKKTTRAQCLYTCPFPDAFSRNKSRPTFRAMRFIDSSTIVLLSNRPARTGAELLVMSFDSLGENSVGSIVQRRLLHSSMKAATSLDLVTLHQKGTTEVQNVLAVAGQDISIELLTLDFDGDKALGMIKPYTTLRNVHPLQMTKVVFSNYIAPAPEASPTPLRLASVSMGNTVVVHTLPLDTTSSRSGRRRTQLRPLFNPSLTILSILSTFVLTLLIAIVLQVYLEVKLGHSHFPSISQSLPAAMQELLGIPNSSASIAIVSAAPFASISAETVTPAATDSVVRAIASILGHPPEHILPEGHRVVVRASAENPLQFSSHLEADLESTEGTKRWEELSEEERDSWKTRLSDAGHWIEGQGETVLKGVFFGSLGGVIAQAVAG